MKRILLGLAATFALGSGNTAMASVIGVVQASPDVSLLQPYLIYDHDGGGAGIGLLTIVAYGSTLYEGAAAGNASQAQQYAPSSSVMRIFVDTATGQLATGQTSTVNIGYGIGSGGRYAWQGTITQLGSQAGAGRIFDAYWVLGSDQYQNLSTTTLGQFTNGAFAGMAGGIIVTNDATGAAAEFGTGNFTFTTDWVYGSAAQNAAIQSQLGTYLASMSSINYMNAATAVDAFVPIPAALSLLMSGLGLFAPMLRRARASA